MIKKKEKMIRISIILPSYNSIKYYRECIESILEQKEKYIEVIPVDAGSTDGTWELILAYAETDPRIKPMISEKKSYGYQCNLGISCAKGEYIGIVESDDYIAADMYTRLYETANTNSLDWVKSDFDFFVDLESRFFLRYHILPSEKSWIYDKVIDIDTFQNIIFRDLNLWNGIYKKDFLDKMHIRFQETNGAAFQDISFVLQTLIRAKRFMYIQGRSYYYRQDHNGSSIYSPLRIRYIRDEFQYIMDFFHIHREKYDQYKAKVLDKLFRDFVGAYISLPCFDRLSDEEVDVIDSFRHCFKKEYEDISFHESLQEGTLLDIRMELLMNDKEQFDFLVHKEQELVENAWRMMIDFLKDKKVVIAGAGECGSAIYAYLKGKGIDTVVGFCDNDPSKIGLLYMDLKIWKVEEACHCFKDGVFLVANYLHYDDIKGQLLSLNIPHERILRSLMITPHGALERRNET